MTAARGAPGVTLLELLVVLTLLGLAAALAAPAFLTPGPPAGEQGAALGAPLRAARDNAIRRAETLYLTVSATGRWRLDTPSDTAAPLATGAARDYAGPPITVVVSPLGTCGLDAASAAAGRSLAFDPLTCAPAGR
jgi:prepilin-type N-terminal cleavage/methylation domain-containing protein